MLAVFALVMPFMGLGGGAQVQVSAAVDAQGITGINAAGLDPGVGTGRQCSILQGDDFVAI